MGPRLGGDHSSQIILFAEHSLSFLSGRFWPNTVIHRACSGLERSNNNRLQQTVMDKGPIPMRQCTDDESGRSAARIVGPLTFQVTAGSVNPAKRT